MCGPTYCLSALIYLGRGGVKKLLRSQISVGGETMAALVGPSCHFSSGNANGSDTVVANVFQKEAQTCGLCPPDTQRCVSKDG